VELNLRLFRVSRTPGTAVLAAVGPGRLRPSMRKGNALLTPVKRSLRVPYLIGGDTSIAEHVLSEKLLAALDGRLTAAIRIESG
jgi:hypothetical protein